MTTSPQIDPSCLEQWFPEEKQRYYINHSIGQVGLTRRQAECFVRLCAYLMVKRKAEKGDLNNQHTAIEHLIPPVGWVECSYQEASELFYPGENQDRGSPRSAGMMLKVLVEKRGLVEKRFDGNLLSLSIKTVAFFPRGNEDDGDGEYSFVVDNFNGRRDAVPIADLLAQNYTWMTSTADNLPHRILRLLRNWSGIYPKGMRILRRSDNNAPIGFYLLFPTTAESATRFFGDANDGLHISSISDEDPFEIAVPGDEDCEAIFIRSWAIEENYRDSDAPVLLLRDAQNTLREMLNDFPNLCDLHTLIIHPRYEPLIQYLGFRPIGQDAESPIYWAYLPLDSFLEREIPDQLPWSVY